MGDLVGGKLVRVVHLKPVDGREEEVVNEDEISPSFGRSLAGFARPLVGDAAPKVGFLTAVRPFAFGDHVFQSGKVGHVSVDVATNARRTEWVHRDLTLDGFEKPVGTLGRLEVGMPASPTVDYVETDGDFLELHGPGIKSAEVLGGREFRGAGLKLDELMRFAAGHSNSR